MTNCYNIVDTLFSRQPFAVKYTKGTAKRVKKVPPRSPPTSTHPICWRLSAPAPVASASGIAPSTIAPVVIRMGRRRMAVALKMASRTDSPPVAALFVRKFNDQNAVLCDEPHQRDEPHLAEDVQRSPRHI